MRLRLMPAMVLVALLLASLITPSSLAQDGADMAPLQVLEDGTEDVALVLPQGGQQASPLPRPTIDLQRLDVAETKDHFRFMLTVASLADEDATGDIIEMYATDFVHQDTQYQVLIGRFTQSDGYFGQLRVHSSSTGRLALVERLDVTADAAAGTLAVDVPRALLHDSQGATPYPGRHLEQFVTLAAANEFLSGGSSFNGIAVEGGGFVDRMPDTGVGTLPFAVRLGIEQSGHARLASNEPFRYSNGEATTFVFRVQATNLGPDDDTFEFSFSGQPAAWDVRTPASTIRLQAEETTEVPVVVRTEFSHDHGNTQRVLVEMSSRSDPSAVGRIEVGILYPEIPQPAGHHDTLWFHSIDRSGDTFNLAFGTLFGTLFGQDSLRDVYMNADPEHADDAGVPVGGWECRGEIVTVTYCWILDLDPQLKMGLDFDLEGLGEVNAGFSTLVPAPGASLGGIVEYVGPPAEEDDFFSRRDYIEVAHIGPSEPVDIGANSAATLAAAVVPLEEADYLPYVDGGHLRVWLELTVERPSTPFFGPSDYPYLVPGGSIRLPLLEYEDAVDDVFGTGGAVALVTEQQQRLVNPGKTVVYAVTLRNDGGLEDAFRIGLAGSNDAWAQILSAKAVTVPAGGEAALSIAVTAPAGAKDEERADLILEAQSAADPNTRALLRLLTIVDTDVEHTDESDLAGLLGQKTEGAPGLAIVPLLATLALSAWLRRRS